MPTRLLSAGYRGGANTPPHPLLPSVQPGDSIPRHLNSHRAQNPSRVGLGPIHAIVELLAGNIRIEKSQQRSLRVTYFSSSKNGRVPKQLYSYFNFSNNTYDWVKPIGRAAPYVLGLAHYVHDPITPNGHEFRARLNNLLHLLTGKLNITLPSDSPDTWNLINNNVEAREAITQLSDDLYHTLKDSLHKQEFKITFDQPQQAILGPEIPQQEILSATSAPNHQEPTPAVAAATTPLARLLRLTKTGGTALLQGPTGTFKTETGKKTALETNAQLITLKGAAGIEDRDFLGSITPTDNGPAWVDGPLTRAFRAAQKSSTVLLIDELLRFEPLYVNVLIGALDTYNEAELNAMNLTPTGTGPHYTLALPTGETITTPKQNLTIIATTNLGSDYEQFHNIDAALLGRFELQIDMPEADADTLKSIYTSIINNEHLITSVIRYETWTRQNTSVTGGLLKRAANPRVMINFLTETQRLLDEQLPMLEALQAAFAVTILPYCAPRDTLGSIAEDTRAVMLDEFNRTITP